MVEVNRDLESHSTHLADFASALNFQDVPTAVKGQVKQTVRDNMAVILAGARSEPSQKLLKSLEGIEPRDDADIIGTHQKSSIRGSAAHGAGMLVCVNGMSGYRSSLAPGLHPAEVVLPVALSLSQRRGISGRAFLESVLAGVESGIRIGRAVMPSHAYKGFHQCATVGAIASAITAGKLMGHSSKIIGDAIGISVIMAPMAIINLQLGLVPPDERYPTAKMLDSPQAARVAIDASRLAADGFTGQRYVLGGPIGFSSATSDDASLQYISEGLGESFEAEIAFYKLYCTTRWFHGAIDLILQLLQEHELGPDDIERVRIGTIRWIALRNRETTPDDHVWECLTGSLSYTAAYAILHPDDMYAPDLYSDWSRPRRHPEVHEYRNRIEVVEDEYFTEAFPGKIPTRVEILTRSGKEVMAQSDYFQGDEPELPLGQDQLDAKFRRFTSQTMAMRHVEELKEILDNIEEIDDMDNVFDVIRTGVAAAEAT